MPERLSARRLTAVSGVAGAGDSARFSQPVPHVGLVANVDIDLERVIVCRNDEGPIIEQDVQRVMHADSSDEIVSVGRDVESRVLARAVKWHCEHRVLQSGHKTVVFS